MEKTRGHPVESSPARGVKGKQETNTALKRKTAIPHGTFRTVCDAAKPTPCTDSNSETTSQTGIKAPQQMPLERNIAEQKTPQLSGNATPPRSSQTANVTQRETPLTTRQQGSDSQQETPQLSGNATPPQTSQTASATQRETPLTTRQQGSDSQPKTPPAGIMAPQLRPPERQIAERKSPQLSGNSTNPTASLTSQTASATHRETPQIETRQMGNNSQQETPQAPQQPSPERKTADLKSPQLSGNTTPPQTSLKVKASEGKQKEMALTERRRQQGSNSQEKTPQTGIKVPQQTRLTTTKQQGNNSQPKTPQTGIKAPEETPPEGNITEPKTPQLSGNITTASLTSQTASATRQQGIDSQPETPHAPPQTSPAFSVQCPPHITQAADEDQVKTWLIKTCGLPDDDLKSFDFTNGATLFAFENHHRLQEVAKIGYGLARRILFLRDHPENNSVMLKWTTDDVIAFIQQSLKPKVKLGSFQENSVDGVALLAFKDAVEMKLHLGINGMLAERVIVERNNFLSEELRLMGKDPIEKTSKPEASPSTARATWPTTADTEGESNVTECHQTPGTHNFQQSASVESSCSDSDKLLVPLAENDKFTTYKLFLQDKLHLEPLLLSKNSKTKKSSKQQLIRCDLKVIYHKRKHMNNLEECFLFLLLCKPGFCTGQAKKADNALLWKKITGQVSYLWFNTLPADDKTRFTFQGGNIQYEGNVITFDEETTKISSLPVYHDTVKDIWSFAATTLIVDQNILKNDCSGYSLELGNRSSSEPFQFGFRNKKKYWIFNSENLELQFTRARVLSFKRGRSQRCRFERKQNESNASVPEKESKKGDPSYTETDSTGIRDVQVTERPEGIIQERTAENAGRHVSDQGEKRKTEEIHVDESLTSQDPKYESTDQTAAARANPLCSPRPFRQQKWTYEEGILRIIETGDGMLTPSAELKFQCGCPPETDLAKRSFLYKGLEFVCGCLNARQNGTIYFGIAEGDIKGEHYEYGQIVGINMDQHLQSEYYDLFRSFIKKCFPREQSEVVKRCVTGPHFVSIRNDSDVRCVMEIDVEPTSKQCEDIPFTFEPKDIFEEYGTPEKKHIYLNNQKSWTGLFQRDGSATQYFKPNERKEFVKEILPQLVAKRQEAENTEDYCNRQLISSPEAEKLKSFIGFIDMFPILILPKLSNEEKVRNIEYFRFLHFIHWAAIFDFDDRSDIDGVYSLSKFSKMEINVHETVVRDFEEVSVDELKDKLCFPTKAAWIFANGKSGDRAFDRLGHEDWKDKYFTSMQTAVHAFYKSKEVIHPTRRRALILISDEIQDGIVELSNEFKTAFGLENIFFVFSSPCTRDHVAKELRSQDNLLSRSIVMPWKHTHNVVCECLNVKGRNRDKFVCTAKGAHVPIPVSEWQSWADVEVLSIKECQEEWEALSKAQRKEKALKEELEFYRGQPVSWLNLLCTDRGYNHVMKRTVQQAMISEIKRKAQSHDRDTDRVPSVPLVYFPGAGGTTLGKNILWELKEEHKCAIVSNITENTAHQICQFWESEEELQEGRVIKRELKPVILFVDNVSTLLSAHNPLHLSRKLFRKQIEYQLSKPIAILIQCRRHEGPADGECQLTQTLSSAEKEWIEKKNDELKAQKNEGIDVETLIAFLSLRNEFDKAKLQDTVLRFINHKSLEKRERTLIEFIALMTSYIPTADGFQGLPVASCDDLMRTFRRKDALVQELSWPRTLTWVAKILLVIEKAYEPVSSRYTYFVRIANQPYAKVILDTVLKENNESLADIVTRCLQSELATSRSPSRKTVTHSLTNMLIKRRVEDEETGEKSQLSPLIMDIYTTGLGRAADVLLEGYKALGNEVFYQQLARLYLRDKMFGDAKRYGQLAVELSPETQEFKHTLGLVYLRIFVSLKERTSFDEKDAKKKLIHLQFAFDAMKNCVEIEGRNTDDIIHNCFSYGQTITVINHVLEFLENILPREELHKLGRYLTQPGYKYPLFDDHVDLPSIGTTLKTLIERGVKALQFLLYIGYSYSNTFTTDGSSLQIFNIRRAVVYVNNTCLKRLKTFARQLKHIHDSSLGNTTEVREDNAYRVDNIKLRGCFFESIFQHLQGGARKKRRENGLADLTKIKHNLEQISDMTHTDMDNLMAVSLALELAGQGTPFSQNYSRFYKMCCQLMRAREENNELCFIRAHMYRILISWFNKNKPGFSVEEFRHSFQRTSSALPLPPRVHFFVAKSDPTLKLCHWTDIYGHEGDDEDIKLTAIATRSEVSQMLEIFTGTHKINTNKKGWQYSHIEMEFRYQNRSFPLTIAKIRGFTVLQEVQVEFYLGFSLHGPVAYICRELPSDGETRVSQ